MTRALKITYLWRNITSYLIASKSKCSSPQLAEVHYYPQCLPKGLVHLTSDYMGEDSTLALEEHQEASQVAGKQCLEKSI